MRTPSAHAQAKCAEMRVGTRYVRMLCDVIFLSLYAGASTVYA